MFTYAVVSLWQGNVLEGKCSGYLAIEKSWPGQLRGVYGDQERFENTYFNLFNGQNQLISGNRYVCVCVCVCTPGMCV